MNRLILAFLFLTLTVSVFAQGVPAPSTPRLMVDSTGTLVSSSNPLPVTLSGTSATTTMFISLPSIGLATRSSTLLATNSVTLLKNIASFTDRDLIWFQPRGKIYWSVLSGSSATAAEMQSTAYSMEAGDTPVMFRLMTNANVAFVADSSAVATLTYTLSREQ